MHLRLCCELFLPRIPYHFFVLLSLDFSILDFQSKLILIEV